MEENSEIVPTMLVILDGFGYRKETFGNAVAQAYMPTWDYFLSTYQHTLLHATGEYVGLPQGFIGNSEVGHLTLGAGRVVDSILKQFHDAIDNESFFKHEVLIRYLKILKESGKALHVMGLLSDGGVHSHERHLYALLRLACSVGISRIFIHPFLDGRDVPPQSAQTYLEKLQSVCQELGCGKIASIHGRFYAMDRDNNWDRIKKSYDVLMGNGVNFEGGWQKYLEKSYQDGITDEFIVPTLLENDGSIKSGDGIIFFNFRPDRARQLTRCFIDPNFDKFEHTGLSTTQQKLSFFISTTRYKKEFEQLNNQILFEKPVIEHTLLDQIADHIQGTKHNVIIIAETEKYAHVTYFFRGMRDIQLPHEKRQLVPSIKAKNYVGHPEMSAPEITNNILESLATEPAYFFVVNYANADMVGHSGDLDATIKACECLDKQLKKLYEAIVVKCSGTMFIVADHGNAEDLKEVESGRPITAHTQNPVPFVLIDKNYENMNIILPVNRGLSYVAPTILKHLKLSVPNEMEESLI